MYRYAVRFNASGCLRCLSFDDDILNAMIDPTYVIDADPAAVAAAAAAAAAEEGEGEAEEDEDEEAAAGKGGKGEGKDGKKKKGGKKGGKKGKKGDGGGGAKGIKNLSELPHLKVYNDAFEKLPTDPKNGKPVPTAGWVKKTKTYKKPGFAAPPSRRGPRLGASRAGESRGGFGTASRRGSAR